MTSIPQRVRFPN